MMRPAPTRVFSSQPYRELKLTAAATASAMEASATEAASTVESTTRVSATRRSAESAIGSSKALRIINVTVAMVLDIGRSEGWPISRTESVDPKPSGEKRRTIHEERRVEPEAERTPE